MHRFTHLILLAGIAYMPLCNADDSCDCNECESDHRGHVQLFFSGTHEVNIQDPREGYEWPGMNEDTFYDYFTK